MLILYPGERYDVLVSGQSSSSRKKTNYIIFETLDYTDMKYRRISPNYALAKLVYEDVSTDSNGNKEKHKFSIQQFILRYTGFYTSLLHTVISVSRRELPVSRHAKSKCLLLH